MFKLYNKDEEIVLPNGKKYSSSDLAELGGYDMLLNTPCAIEELGGVVYSYSNLGSLAREYNVSDEGTPDEILIRINLAKKLNEQVVSLQPSVQKAAQIAALSFTDEQALEVPDLYPEYAVDHEYKKDDRFTYNGRLFKVNQDHTSAAQWVPGETGTESLYTCLEMAGDGYLVWTQPTGAHNAYNTGDIVHYPTADDPLYKSTIDGNVWAPDAYPQGWEIYTEE